jgi:putative ABC transport system permease protein
VSAAFIKRTGTGVAFRETFWLSLDTLRVHKLRSFLTLLGVILAVFTLVLVMSLVHGLNRYIADRVANMGSNVFVVNKTGICTSWETCMKVQKRPPIRMDDYIGLKEASRLAKDIAAGDDNRTTVRYANEALEDVDLLGTTANFAEIRGIEVGQGRFVTETDDSHRSPVCFVGTDIVNRFFPSSDPITKTIRVGPHSCQIVGVAKTMGSVFGNSRDNFVIFPLGTYAKWWLRPNDSLFLLVQAHQPEQMANVEDEVRAILRARRHVPYHDPDNFGIISPTSITNLWEELTGQIFAMIVGITSVFLVVGGIVIMNIMLASVVERTREIGIRKSLGARRRHIVMQFLVESATLAATGGAIGIAVAVLLVTIIATAFDFPIATSMSGVITALTLSTGVGLFFGIYPAVRAARLDPIEALRAEA